MPVADLTAEAMFSMADLKSDENVRFTFFLSIGVTQSEFPHRKNEPLLFNRKGRGGCKVKIYLCGTSRS